MGGTVPIRFGTYNIRNGRKGGLESALRGMSQANMDLGILQENKLTNGVYTCGSAGNKVIATDAPSRHCGGVALFYRPTPRFTVEAVEKCDAAAVLARLISRDDCVAGRPAGVDPIRDLGLLEDAQVHIGMGHPAECRLQPSPLPLRML